MEEEEPKTKRHINLNKLESVEKVTDLHISELKRYTPSEHF